jgi:flagellar basal body P-ring protein FlgI
MMTTLTELRNALDRAVDGQIDAVRQGTIQSADTMGELVRTNVLENGRLVAARKIHADLERLTGELERLMTGRVEP